MVIAPPTSHIGEAICSSTGEFGPWRVGELETSSCQVDGKNTEARLRVILGREWSGTGSFLVAFKAILMPSPGIVKFATNLC